MKKEPPSLEEIASRFKPGDPIYWRSATNDRRRGHQGVGTYEGTLDGRVLVRYTVSTRISMQKTITVRPAYVLLDGPKELEEKHE